jgi:hypothetical protein
VIVPRALVHQSQFESAVKEVEGAFRPEIVRVRYDFGDDSTGEPAVFFRILLSDTASRRDRLRGIASRIETAIYRRVEPLEQWGVLPYFTYRSQSEQAQLNDPAWA